MVDREKAIKGLECCAEAKCEVCPYEEQCFDEEICICSPMAKDMLALLKAQEAVEPRIEKTILSQKYNENLFKNYYCGNCGEFLHKVIRIDKFCSQCGRAVKWE